MGVCCVECFDDEFIQEHIKGFDVMGSCEYCKSENVYTADTANVGEVIRAGLERAYENVDQAGVRYDDGEDVFEVLNFGEVIFSERLHDKGDARELCQDLLNDSANFGSDEADPYDYYDASILLKDEFYGADYNEYSYSWEAFKHQVKHFGRFFDFHGESREALLGPIMSLITDSKITLNKNSVIWRGTYLTGEKLSEPQDFCNAVGPAPYKYAAHNRMSPAGISYMYACENPHTCISEIKPDVGIKIQLGKFRLTKDLKILDLTLIPNIRVKSIFDSEYAHNLRWAIDFMKHFTDQISKPLSKEDTYLEYIPTQVLAEFIRMKGFDGIKFKSSQDETGLNYTLFFGPVDEKCFEENSLELYTKYMYLESYQVMSVGVVTYSFSNYGSEVNFTEGDFTNEESDRGFKCFINGEYSF